MCVGWAVEVWRLLWRQKVVVEGFADEGQCCRGVGAAAEVWGVLLWKCAGEPNRTRTE